MWHKPHLLNAIADLLLLVGGVALAAAAALWLVRMPVLPVKQVVFVEALPHTRVPEVDQALTESLRGNFFSLNLENVRASLEELPWVRKADVRRIWPSKLEVRVEEHKPVARWGEGRGELVNSYGEIFSAIPSGEELKGLPMLFGPEGTAPDLLKRYAELIEAFATLNERPMELTLSPRLAWQTRLASGMVVALGREQPKSPVDARLQRFIEVYPEWVGKRAARPAVIDLRYPHGFAVRSAGEQKGK